MSDPFVISGLGTSGITKHADESPGAAMFCRAEWRERDGNVLTQLTFSSSLPQSFSVVLRISELYLRISALRLPSDSGNDHIQRPCQQHIWCEICCHAICVTSLQPKNAPLWKFKHYFPLFVFGPLNLMLHWASKNISYLFFRKRFSM